jgi:hypothetical protein
MQLSLDVAAKLLVLKLPAVASEHLSMRKADAAVQLSLAAEC